MAAPRFMRAFSATASSSGLQDVVVVASARTAIGSIGGVLASVAAPHLGATVIKGALVRAGLKPTAVDEVIMGNVISAGLGQAPARQAAIFAGLPESTVCTTVNKVCASGMKAVMYGAQSIALGHSSLVVAGGMESMSNVPYLLPHARYGMKYGHGAVLDGCVKDGLWDVYNDCAMGVCGEKTSADMGITRKDQDEYAMESYRRAAAAADYFKNEIVGVTVAGRKGEHLVTVDEEPGKAQFDKMPTLKPVFKKDGTITAANASKLNDGAAALILMSAAKAAELGVKPLARIRGYGDAEQAPIDFPTAPAKAVPVALRRAGLTGKDVDYHEVNEAFAAVALANARMLNISLDRLNVFGGGVSLGHPIGASGARIIGTLLNVLTVKDATIGVASICNGGGGASAIVLERLA